MNGLLIERISSTYLTVWAKCRRMADCPEAIEVIANSSSKVKRKKFARKTAQFVPMGIPIICLYTLSPKETKQLSMRRSKKELREEAVWYVVLGL
jgi:hypothetical protein